MTKLKNYELMILSKAARIAEAASVGEVWELTSPNSTTNYLNKYLTYKLSALGHEEFHVIYLDNQHKVISTEMLARGTINSASVYPREVVKGALMANAAAVILCHNHPSGSLVASDSDIRLTDKLAEALGTIDIKVLDHVIVAKGELVSMANLNLMPSRNL